MKQPMQAKELKGFVEDMKRASQLSKDYYMQVLEADPLVSKADTQEQMDRCVSVVDVLEKTISEGEAILAQNRYVYGLVRNEESPHKVKKEEGVGRSLCASWNENHPNERVVFKLS